MFLAQDNVVHGLTLAKDDVKSLEMSCGTTPIDLSHCGAQML